MSENASVRFGRWWTFCAHDVNRVVTSSSSVSSCQVGPQCRLGELGDDPVRGRLGRDVQWTDDGCGQCLTEMAAQCGSVSHHW